MGVVGLATWTFGVSAAGVSLRCELACPEPSFASKIKRVFVSLLRDPSLLRASCGACSFGGFAARGCFTASWGTSLPWLGVMPGTTPIELRCSFLILGALMLNSLRLADPTKVLLLLQMALKFEPPVVLLVLISVLSTCGSSTKKMLSPNITISFWPS